MWADSAASMCNQGYGETAVSHLSKVGAVIVLDTHLPAVNGSQRKGIVVTSTGVLFCNGKGGKLYAYDADNGKLLWETTLHHESNTQPIMYELNGKQYLVVNATNNFTKDSYDHSKDPGALPRGYVVYALPDKKL